TDALAGNQELVQQYQEQFRQYHQLLKHLQQLIDNKHTFQQELDYKQYLLQELEEFDVQENEIEQLAAESKSLENTDEIRQNINNIVYMLEEDENAVNHQVKKMLQPLQQITKWLPDTSSLYDRLNSVWIELKDIKDELGTSLDKID